jgi:hypothetical protein
MHVPNLDWAPDLFADEPGARREPPDDAASMWPTMANAWTFGAATAAVRQRPDGDMAKAA